MPVKKGDFMAKNKKETEEEAIERRKRTYGCDGCCYGHRTDLPIGHPERKGMCMAAETCPENATREFFWTVISVITYLLFFNPIAWIIWLLVIDYLLSK